MALAVEQDKAPRPAAVRPLSANAAMFGAQTRTHLIQQPRRMVGRGEVGRLAIHYGVLFELL